MGFFAGLDHVQLAAPPGCEEAGRDFFGRLLELEEIPRPAALAGRGGLWFRCGAQQLHVGVEKDFRPARKAHPALELTDLAAFDALLARLTAAGIPVDRPEEMEDALRFFVHDPWGNRLELTLPRR
jgi:catechol 2,3-dioxygenase-like lactoylglutathione lyase family enzyme